ncbi:stage V sporulation protein AD [Clostridia bacterium]|nr:stage V sporulation protein AD [Clostridia bacterium]
MAKRIGQFTLHFENRPSIKSFASITGKKEKEGPLGKYFDKAFDDNYFGETTWEKAESYLQTETVKMALKKAGIEATEVNYIFAGDLLNQCISSTFGLRSLGIPFLGQYGACSTMAQTLIMASIMVESKIAKNCIAVTSSHFCSAERQYRLPLEYGGQRPQSAQWTTTGSGAMVVSLDMNKTYVEHATVGKMVDLGSKDIANMGAAMAPAACETLSNFFNDTKTIPDDYDLVLTGDLGVVGGDLLKKLLKKEGFVFGENYNDCGLMIYNKEKQDVHSGGSGCGCSGSVLCSIILSRMQNNELNNILFVATGALMSPTSSQQGETIPAIAHLVHLKNR